MTKRQYLTLCLAQPVAWLERCAADPSPGMTARHVALARLAIRQLRRRLVEAEARWCQRDAIGELTSLRHPPYRLRELLGLAAPWYEG